MLSFDEIDNNIYNSGLCYAHSKISGGDKVYEILSEHTLLCQKYFSEIWEAKKISNILDRIWENLFNEFPPQEYTLFERLFINTITYHDTGKINSLFQKEKMGVKDNGKFLCISGIGSRHSKLSSYIYINNYSCMINCISDIKLKKKFAAILLINAFLINRHHSNINDISDFFDKMKDDESIIDSLGQIYPGFIPYKQILVYIKATREYFRAYDTNKSISLYTYSRLLYSILVASDYYATTQFMNGVEIENFGNIEEIKQFIEIFEAVPKNRKTREYETYEYGNINKMFDNVKDINILRKEMFLDAEKKLFKNMEKSIFFLEAPTGSGKSNTAFNLSFKLIEHIADINKIIYVYPFNTLIDQNLKTLNEVFGENKDVFRKISVVNSTAPIKVNEEDVDEKYIKALLDRQFQNYPVMLTSHVSLFNTMFGNDRESAFSFHQLANSVIILDEIQTYKNEIWSEIILFLKNFADILNIKVIIMSATLPDLGKLISPETHITSLIDDREKYFSSPVFKNRVKINYGLLNVTVDINLIAEHINTHHMGQKVLIEFINKNNSYDFYDLLKNNLPDYEIQLINGDDNPNERARILNIVKNNKDGMILVATQVVEAGVDIDMDVGYKDISRLDSEEQFLGRINRSCLKNGIVYFFNLYDAKKIYNGDIRIIEEFTLKESNMQEILKDKSFSYYYEEILNYLKLNNERANDYNLEEFFAESVGKLDFAAVEKRMRLIEDNNMNTVFFNRELEDINGDILNGEKIWEQYKMLLQDNEMDYSKKQIKLFNIRTKMNNFIYQINRKFDVIGDQIGELFYIDDGEKYFRNGKLDKEQFKYNGLFL